MDQSNPPSRVLHFRNVGPEISQADILALCVPFGPVANLIMLRSKNQALLQFQDITSAKNFIGYFSGSSNPNIRGRNIFPQFSSHQELTLSSPADSNPNSRILLVTIQNPIYPITVDVLNQVFSPYEITRGTVEKIVIFSKSLGLQALIQFSSNECARNARSSLDGKNIYSNSCTLQIQYSTLSELTITQNSEKTRDFTNPGLPSGPPFDVHAQMQAQMGMNAAHMQNMMPPQGHMGGGAFFGVERSVLLVNGLHERITCDMLFNLFSTYGNIVRIKILHNKPDHALIQMGDNWQAQNAMSFLKGLHLFGSTIDINYSRHHSISMPHLPTDGKTQDYTNSPLNRFRQGAGTKNYRHISPPTEVLHMSSVAPNIAEQEITEHMSHHAPVNRVRIFESSGRRQALVQFDTPEQAAETLCLLHNSPLGGQKVKLSFSKNHL
eukprot:gnl/Trimastix_PCT/736.p1 GENE.gnl/Trimastix_PCT/736~~gnl/Trimastix_PCT/736.p1  ORF type:complete len:467 (+),score=110.36 gnl/Trimastix_PCT/736:88-1401(+)